RFEFGIRGREIRNDQVTDLVKERLFLPEMLAAVIDRTPHYLTQNVVAALVPRQNAVRNGKRRRTRVIRDHTARKLLRFIQRFVNTHPINNNIHPQSPEPRRGPVASPVIDLTTVADLHGDDDKLRVLDVVKNSVIPLADTIAFIADKLLAARRTRVVCKRHRASEYPLYVLFGDRCEAAIETFREPNAIFCHRPLVGQAAPRRSFAARAQRSRTHADPPHPRQERSEANHSRYRTSTGSYGRI